jgi:hypothetical protein
MFSLLRCCAFNLESPSTARYCARRRFHSKLVPDCHFEWSRCRPSHRSLRCPWCARLADKYAALIKESLPAASRPLWLISGDSASALAWARAHGLPRTDVAAVLPYRASPFRRPVFGRIWVTPTRIVLAPGMVVRDARPAPANQLLTVEQLENICEQGGVAPQSVEELRQLARDSLLGSGLPTGRGGKY